MRVGVRHRGAGRRRAAPPVLVAGDAVDPAIAQRALAASAVARRAAAASSVSDGTTLEAAVSGAWEVLVAHRVVSCVVCGGAMAPRYGAAGTPLGGRCADCGSSLG
jgi:hypothetical protein